MTSFEELIDIKEIETFIATSHLAFLYISKPNCSVCESLLPQIEAVMEQYPMIKTASIDTTKTPEIAGRFNIFTVPVLLLFFAGKEYLREARIVPIARFNDKVKRIVESIEESENNK
ncbi:thioredoxin family protein [Amphibacillus sp. Q70]|uniref:thioredoxin family protein n=1 Tax=Amphibacillus sp. Q70 TaxID=3453416 RepID=UPI003F82950C